MEMSDPPASRLLSRLDGVRQTGPDKWIARCPAHDDKTPSLSLKEAQDGAMLVHCWGGCRTEDVVQSVGLTMASLFPRNSVVPTRTRWDRADAWQCLVADVGFVAIIAADIVSGRGITKEDASRAGVAADRLAAAIATLGIAP